MQLHKDPTLNTLANNDQEDIVYLGAGERLTESFNDGPATFDSANNPKRPVVTLEISGTICTHLGIHPSAIVLSDVKRARGRSVSATVYSQIWNRFTIKSVETSFDGLTWDVSAVPERTLDQLEAVSGYELRMTLPAEMPVGRFSYSVRLTVHCGAKEPRSESLEFPLAGNVLGRVSVAGPRLDSRKIVHVGALSAGEGARERLILQFHDSLGDVAIERIETVPEFLSARVVPRTQASARSGVY